MSVEADHIKRPTYKTPDLRPGYHYTPTKNWMSDPNGLIWHQGEYHMFYQHDTYNEVFSKMSWGHAVSKDLIHWKELPTAIAPSDDGLGMIFSGGTVVDERNLAGFGENTMFALYTSPSPKQQQSLAYSKDRGRTWHKYENNPVIQNLPEKGMTEDFRDPKLMWHDAGNCWIMSIAARDHIEFWSSKNLLHWDKESEFGQGYGAHEHRGNGSWECPDLLKLPVEDGNGQSLWVLLVSMNQGGPNGECGTQYFVGDFVYKHGVWCFESHHKEVKWLDYGPDSYAGVTFTHVEDRAVMVAWMSNWQYALDIPTGPWKGVTSFPRELKVRKAGDDTYLACQPIRELDTISQAMPEADKSLKANVDHRLEGISTSRLIVEAEDLEDNTLEIEFTNDKKEKILIGYDPVQNQIYFDRRHSGHTDFRENFADRVYTMPTEKGMSALKLEIMLDKMTVEIFGQEGRYTMSGLMFPTDPYNRLHVRSFCKKTRIRIHKIARMY